MQRNLTFGLGIAIASIALAALPLALDAQGALPAARSPITKDTSTTTVLARNAIQEFFPSVLADSSNPGALFIIVGPDGSIIDAAHGSMQDMSKLKAKHGDFDARVESREIRIVPAGALLSRPLTVVITKFKT